jgi:hypothetical protein
MGPKHIWASSIFFEKKDQSTKGQTRKTKDAFSLSALAVLLAATTMCTYNVGGCTMGVRCTLVIHLWPCALSKDFCALQGGD